MMPTLASVIDAIPRCPKHAPVKGPVSNMPSRKPCLQRLRYVNVTNDWRCVEHGVVLAGSELVLTRAGYAVDDDGDVLAA